MDLLAGVVTLRLIGCINWPPLIQLTNLTIIILQINKKTISVLEFICKIFQLYNRVLKGTFSSTYILISFVKGLSGSLNRM